MYITGEQIPLMLAWAVNIHKMRGVTRDRIVVDFWNNMFAKGIAYVAFSRCRSLNSLAVPHLNAAKLLRTDTYTPCCEKTLAEMQITCTKSVQL